MKRARVVGSLGMGLALAVSLANVASAAPASFQVQPVGRPQVKRLLVWSLQAPSVPDAATAPPTCAKDHLGVYMLPIPNGAGAKEVSCTVPTYSWLVLNVGGAVCFGKPGVPGDALVSACKELRSKVNLDASVTVDGKPARLFPDASTGPFTVNAPDPEGKQPPRPVVTDFEGRNVMITGLAKGTHDIRLRNHITSPEEPNKAVDIDLTYHVTFA